MKTGREAVLERIFNDHMKKKDPNNLLLKPICAF